MQGCAGMKTLVIWHSRTGTTTAVADEIVRLTGWDRDEIVDRRGSRLGLASFVRRALESRLRMSVPLAPAGKDPAGYELVVIGTPVWAGRVSSPVATYLRMHATSVARVALFVTHSGAGAHAALAELERMVGRAPESRLIVRDLDVESGDFRVPVRGFVDILRERTSRIDLDLGHPGIGDWDSVATD